MLGRWASFVPTHRSQRNHGEDVATPKGSSLRDHVFMYLRGIGYGIKLVNIDGFTRSMSQVKWSTDNAFGLTDIDLFKGPVVDLLHLVVMDLRSLYAMEPLLLFLKVMFCGGGFGSLAPKSHLID
ncbi:La-related protein 6 [Hordeum vulgare]|nr:La-related protein 6 [Hordeum vulgare]